MNQQEGAIVLGIIAGFVWTAFVFGVAYSTTLDSVNEDCIKTGHFYVIDNVFKCELIVDKSDK